MHEANVLLRWVEHCQDVRKHVKNVYNDSNHENKEQIKCLIQECNSEPYSITKCSCLQNILHRL
jgi:hypothetical protein